MKDGKVVSAIQTKSDKELEDMMRKATWVNITKGMELSKRVEYKQESRGRAFMLDPSNPKELNIADKQSVKMLNTAATGGLIYTTAFSASLGEMAYIPMEDDDVDSQETDDFEQDPDESDEDGVDNKGIISNIIDITKLSGEEAPQQFEEMAVDDNEDEDKVQEVDTDVEMIHSPKKVTRTATVHSGILKETEEQKSSIRSMVDEWTADHKDEQLPPQLAALAARAGLTLKKVVSTQSQRGKKDKVKVDTPAASEGAIANSLQGLRFVLLGTWPDLGGGQGLTLGKLCLKSRIEKFGGLVTSNYSCLTNFLVVGTNPGPKKIIDTHERKLEIIDINQLTKIMVGGW
jgi:BRCT domain type II-containing protein